MKRLAPVVLAFSLTACGVGELAETETEIGVLRQAGNVNQGNVNQGNVNQGNVNQGNWLGAKVINSATMVFAAGSGAPSVSGTVLMRGTTPVRPAPAGNPRVAHASFELIGLTSSGALDVTKKASARIVGSFVDQQNYPGADARNMLAAPYRDRSKSGEAIVQNGDVVFYQVEVFHLATQSWGPLCPSSTPSNAAIVFPGYFDALGEYRTAAGRLGFACADGTAAKCTRWGYKHWRSLTPAGTSTPVSLMPLFKACTRAAMADYCGANVANTEPLTPIDLSDVWGFIPATPKTNAWAADGLNTSAESAFDTSGALCVAHDRIGSIQTCPTTYEFIDGSSCTTAMSGWTWSACGPKGLTTLRSFAFDRGAIGACTANAAAQTQRSPLIFVGSGMLVCSHAPTESGPSLAADCNCLTMNVCGKTGLRPDGQPWSACCQMGATGAPVDNAWTGECLAEATRISTLELSCTQQTF
jgi:hypothetical protein